ncbi:MAG: molybdopterin molybdotransferase MoeA [Candidatus Adiutrix sp.]|jgi:molybdopterin molybdotransferase|nr:molybdopterin molybdotransferase MoeA [Candidatus Adiutrix sp.]
MSKFLTLKSADEIFEMLNFDPLPPETLPLDQALGRVLAEPFPASEDLPGFDRSTVDGFAVRARDVFGATEGLPAALEYLGECPMGDVPQLTVGPGQTARIWTGGMLPPGADGVVMLEYSRPAGDKLVELTRPAAPLENVISRGEDASCGEELLPSGRSLRPQDLGLLAALGQTEARVIRRPRAAIISSGDEVVPVTATPRPGQVRDINSHTLAALVRSAGGEARSFGLAPDHRDKLRAMVAEALDWADLVVMSGGSSAGQRDFTILVFGDLPGVEILAHGVAISPGKPLILARQGQKSLWGLPGHAAGALVCAEVFLRPLIKRLTGQTDPEVWRAGLTASLTRPVASAQGRRDYIRVSLAPPETPGGPLQATPILGKSGLISTLVLAEALVVCPENLEGLEAGQIVPLHLSL